MAPTPTFRSFAEQTLHYFDRPHTGLPAGPVGGTAAWRVADLTADPGAWTHTFTADEVAELAAAADGVERSGVPMGSLTAADVPLPGLAPRIEAWRSALTGGRGLVLLRGLPVQEWGEDRSAVVYWTLGVHLGWPGAQNTAGDLLGHVIDTGDDRDDPMVRLYRTSSYIRFHCDAADVVGLLCLQPARSGGASRIASSVAVHDELWRTSPDLAQRLYDPFELDTRGDGSSLLHFPVPACRYDGTTVRTFFHSDYFRSVTRHPDVAPLTPETEAALDAFEALADDPAFRFDMELAAGDIQLISNHAVVHARTAYEDDPAHPRHLLRLWLSLPAPVPPATAAPASASR